MARIAPLLLIAWFPFALLVFPAFTRRRGMLLLLLVGVLFLPEVGSVGSASGGVSPVKLGILLFSKDRVISFALILAALVYDSKSLLSGRPAWTDLPMIVWCLCPALSVFNNNPPPDGSPMERDALAQVFHQTTLWGIPYLIGRTYFSDARSLRDLILACVIGAVIYIPLCLFEMRLSPQLHRMVYGFAQHSFAQTVREDGYRPMVFLPHGLALAVWMALSLVMGAWLWWARQKNGAGRVLDTTNRYLGWALIALVPTVVLLKSWGALALGVAGVGLLAFSRWMPSRVWLLLIVSIPPAYVYLRTSGDWNAEDVSTFVRDNLSRNRAQSLQFRLDNENMLINRALERPVFGWAGWGRARIYDDEGRDVSVTDGLWIIALGDRGIFGLTALGLVLLLPGFRLAFELPPRFFMQPAAAPVAACGVALGLWACDQLMNGNYNPLFAVMAGGLAGVDLLALRRGREVVSDAADPLVRPRPTVAWRGSAAPPCPNS